MVQSTCTLCQNFCRIRIVSELVVENEDPVRVETLIDNVRLELHIHGKLDILKLVVLDLAARANFFVSVDERRGRVQIQIHQQEASCNSGQDAAAAGCHEG